MYIYIYTYIYIYSVSMCRCVYTYIYIYIHTDLHIYIWFRGQFTYGQTPHWGSECQGAWRQQNLDIKRWNSHVHRKFAGQRAVSEYLDPGFLIAWIVVTWVGRSISVVSCSPCRRMGLVAHRWVVVVVLSWFLVYLLNKLFICTCLCLNYRSAFLLRVSFDQAAAMITPTLLVYSARPGRSPARQTQANTERQRHTKRDRDWQRGDSRDIQQREREREGYANGILYIYK